MSGQKREPNLIQKFRKVPLEEMAFQLRPEGLVGINQKTGELGRDYLFGGRGKHLVLSAQGKEELGNSEEV